MKTLHACKNFNNESKTKSRLKSVIEPVQKFWGRIPDNKIILTTSGLYSEDKTGLEIYQYLKSGIIRFHKQFLGVDSGICDGGGKINIAEENTRRYGKGKKYYVPFEWNDIAVSCTIHKDKIAFINLDMQNGIELSFPKFVSILKIMKDVPSYGIAFNSMLSTGYTSYLDHFETVRVGMERLLKKYIQEQIELDSSVVELFNQLKLVRMDAYDGTAPSVSVMGTYVFFKNKKGETLNV